MYLKSIELSGFKSFGKKISLEFGSRISSIVGPNGSGKCVTPDTLIQLADGRRLPIQYLFDEANISPKRVRVYEDGVAVFANEESPEVFTLDLKSGKLVKRPIAAFVRRTAPANLLTIVTRSGKKITTTPYHPLFTLKSGTLVALRADEVTTGVRIASARRTSVDAQPYHFSMLGVISKFTAEDLVYLPYSEAMVQSAIGLGSRSATRIGNGFGVQSSVVQGWLEGQSLPSRAANCIFAGTNEMQSFPDRILKSKTTGTMRVPEVLDERMARFLGYLIAEGRNCRNGQIRFVNDDMPLVDDFVTCARESFAVSTSVREYKGRGIQDAFISSMTLSRFLDRVMGITQDGHSRDKSVPAQIFASPDAVVANFLAALFEGDSYVHCSTAKSRGAYIEYATASEKLARGIVSLLLRFGVTATLRATLKKATNSPHPVIRTYWSVFISGSENLATFAAAISFRGRKKVALAKVYNPDVKGNPNLDFVPDGCHIVKEAAKAAGVSVKLARREYPTLAAYCELRCEATRGGIIRSIEAIRKYGKTVSKARKQLERLAELAETDVLWDEVISVENKPGSGFVYDLTVVDHHNFLAGDVIVHNSNVADGFRFVLGEQSMKSMRGKKGEDMIWGGSPALPRMNRAGVKVVFDNPPVGGGKRLLDIDFSEVAIERIVHRDGQNEYLLNGSSVRLKDVIRLLAGANIGGSGYQIISQGEADRILNASPRERREMVEDALGLKLFQHKKAESERKLEETAINIEKTKSLRREIAPHLKFLQVQVEKIEKAREMKEELAAKLTEYLTRENAWITHESTRLHDELTESTAHIHELDARLKEIRVQKGGGHDSSAGDALFARLGVLQRELSDARRRREDIVRELGRAEGALEAANVTVESIVPVPHVREFAREISEAIEEAEHIHDVEALRNVLHTLRNRIKAFVDGLTGTAPMTNKESEDAVVRLTAALEKAEADEARLSGDMEAARSAMTSAREARFSAEKEEVEAEAKLREAQSKMLTLRSEREHVADLKRRFEEEVREGIILLGMAMEGWHKASERGEIPEGALSEDRTEQEKRRRAVERLKIKIEEAGVGGGDAVMKEYRQTEERDVFLAKELVDLEKSEASLRDLIVELEKTIDARFTEGLTHINAALHGFFQKLFGGGDAKLFVESPRGRKKDVDMEDGEIPETGDELYAGLSIDVSLPRKKIRGLEVLSGGERALTSIALIFSMSQVNPPPFLILDETDAALDEANSKRYADMIVELGKHSQLIVITHNRATMAAAGELYGVTMGQDGVSKVLSVKLEEAEKVAK